MALAHACGVSGYTGGNDSVTSGLATTQSQCGLLVYNSRKFSSIVENENND